jgi:hypothetical protein
MTFEELLKNPDLEAVEPAKRKTAAQLLLLARLENLQPISDTTAIDLNYITCAEYQLFLDEIRQRDKLEYPDSWFQLPLEDTKKQTIYYRQPDHWTSYQFPPGTAAQPITGVRSRDTQFFCAWLNRKLSNKPFSYRLPTAEEALRYPAHQSDLAAWCGQNNVFSLEGLSETVFEKYVANTAEVLQQPVIKAELRAATQDADRLMQEFNGFDADLTGWDYQKIKVLSHTSNALTIALGLHYGYPGRDFIVATAYDIAYTQIICSYYGTGRYRALDDSEKFNGIRNFVINQELRLSGYIKFETALQTNKADEARQIIEDLARAEDVHDQRWSVILRAYLYLHEAQTPIEVRQACRYMASYLLDFLQLGYDILLDEIENRTISSKYGRNYKYLPHFYRNFLRLFQYTEAKKQARREVTAKYKKLLTTFSLQLKLLIAREKGLLPAWESIRIVQTAK